MLTVSTANFLAVNGRGVQNNRRDKRRPIDPSHGPKAKAHSSQRVSGLELHPERPFIRAKRLGRNKSCRSVGQGDFRDWPCEYGQVFSIRLEWNRFAGHHSVGKCFGITCRICPSAASCSAVCEGYGEECHGSLRVLCAG